MEIERKYLVRQLPEALETFEHVDMEQGYLNQSPTVRIRKAGDFFYLTVKEKAQIASTAIHNLEEEFALSQDAYLHLRLKCDGHFVCKRRYRIPFGQYMIELDVFSGQHQGLILAEVEFPNTAEADAFVPPAWFGEDVSQDPRYRNVALALNS